MKRILAVCLSVLMIAGLAAPAYAASSTRKAGDSGVYAYKSRGGRVVNYWVVDFDAGYCYFLQEGSGSDSYDRIKIVSGDLNSGVKITFHDGGDTWSYYLHFKWKNQPDHLVVVDNDGFTYDYYETDWSSVRKLLQDRTKTDY